MSICNNCNNPPSYLHKRVGDLRDNSCLIWTGTPGFYTDPTSFDGNETGVVGVSEFAASTPLHLRNQVEFYVSIIIEVRI